MLGDDINVQTGERAESVGSKTAHELAVYGRGLVNNGPLAEYDPELYDWKDDAWKAHFDYGLKARFGLTETAEDYEDYLSQLNDVVAGNAPSVAVLEREKGRDQAQRQALSMAASSRDPGAWRDAIDAGAMAANSSDMDAAIIRAQEIDAARGRIEEGLGGQAAVWDQYGNLIDTQQQAWINYMEEGRAFERDQFEAALADYELRFGQLNEMERMVLEYRIAEANNRVQLEGFQAGAYGAAAGNMTQVYMGDADRAVDAKNAQTDAISTGLGTAANNIFGGDDNPDPFIPDQPTSTSPSGSGPVDPRYPDGDPRNSKPKPY
jgi:hypothetical protein